MYTHGPESHTFIYFALDENTHMYAVEFAAESQSASLNQETFACRKVWTHEIACLFYQLVRFSNENNMEIQSDSVLRMSTRTTS